MKVVLGLGLIICLAVVRPASAADFDGDSRADIAIFRPSAGLWAIRGVTRVYFGSSSDTPAADDYNADGITDIGIFRGSSGLWAIRDVTRAYFGSSSDIPITGGGGGPRTFDYVVKPSDGDDLVNALTGPHQSVFIPAGTYNITQIINVPVGLRLIQGEVIGTIIQFAGDGQYLSIDSPYCVIDRLMVVGGGDISASIGNFLVNSDYVTVSNCWSWSSLDSGFDVAVGMTGASFINCISEGAETAGFNNQSSAYPTRVTNCMVKAGSADNPAYGFKGMTNLSSCFVDGNDGNSYVGFFECEDLAACRAIHFYQSSFSSCKRLSGCTAIGSPGQVSGFDNCRNLSSCHAENIGLGIEYISCWKMDTDSCD